MDKTKEFVKDHKKDIIFAACCIVIYKIGWRRGWKSYKNVVNSVLKTLDKSGYNIYKIIEPEVK